MNADRGRATTDPVPAAAAALLVLLAAACSGGFGPDDSDSALVFGRVTAAADSAPVAAAEVNVTAFSGNCGSNIFSGVSATTDSSGRYATSVISFRSRLRRCLEVEAVPPQGSGLRPGLVRIPNIDVTGSDAVDSLRVDVSLDSVP